MTRTEWLLEKKKYVTSTDPAVLLGMGFQNQSVEKLYQFKTTSTLEEDEPSELMELGTYLESYIQIKCEKFFAQKLGLPEYFLQRSGFNLFVSSKNNWQATSIDLSIRKKGKFDPLVETKAVFGYPSSDWGPSGTDLIPEKYIIQCQHQMGVLELEEMYLAALFVSSGEFRMYKIHYNEQFFRLISRVEQSFWDLVINRLGVSAWDEYLIGRMPGIRSHLPKVQEGIKISLDSEAESLIENYIQAVDIWSQMEEEAKSLKDRLIAIMGEAEVGESEKYLIKRPLVKTKNPYRKFVVEAKENA